ncbi:MAG: hypothetical protein U0840_18350 [Gemmataceae bacterium]
MRRPRIRLALEHLEDRLTPAELIVRNGASGDVPNSLHRAILNANAEPGFDVIYFDAEVFGPGKQEAITLTQALPRITDDLMIFTLDGMAITIQRAASAPDFRVLEIATGVTVQLTGLGFAGGRADQGAGIFNQGDLTLTRCVVENNVATQQGGGIYTDGAALTLVDTLVRFNIATDRGGGVYVAGGTFTHAENDVISNSTRSGRDPNIGYAELPIDGTLALDLSSQDQFINVGATFSRSGDVVGFTKQVTSLTVEYGDGSPTDTIRLTGTLDFTLNHIYREEGSFRVVTTLWSGDQVADVEVFTVDVLLAGVPTGTAVKEEVKPGEEVAVVVPGASVFFSHGAASLDPAAIIVAVVPIPVAEDLDTPYFALRNQSVVASFDIRALNVAHNDIALVTFAVAGLRAGDVPSLTYFDPVTGRQVRVQSSLVLIDPVQQTITFRLDAASMPSLLNLGGTVFTISVPLPVPVDPLPPASPLGPATEAIANPNLGTQVALALEARGDGVNGGSAQVHLARAELIGRDFASPGPTRSARLSTTTANGGGSTTGEGTDADPMLNEPLSELPTVPSVLTDLPSVAVTPAGSEPLPPPPVMEEPTPASEEEQKERTYHDEERGFDLPGEPASAWVLESALVALAAWLVPPGREPRRRERLVPCYG